MSGSDTIKYQPRCLICNHPEKDKIHKMLVSGYSFISIEREFEDTDHPAPRRSVSGHASQHLNYEDRALRELIESQAEEHGINVETHTKRLIQNRTYLQIYVDKAAQQLVENNVIIEPRDAMRAIELLDKLEQSGINWTIDKIQRQYDALVTAVKEIVPGHLMSAIVERSLDIYENRENIPDAEVVPSSDSDNRKEPLELSESSELPSDS